MKPTDAGDATERRTVTSLSRQQIEEIAEIAAERAIEKMKTELYIEVGRGIVSRSLIILGFVASSIVLFAAKDIKLSDLMGK
jgi:diaminopimelate decarboxylase